MGVAYRSCPVPDDLLEGELRGDVPVLRLLWLAYWLRVRHCVGITVVVWLLRPWCIPKPSTCLGILDSRRTTPRGPPSSLNSSLSPPLPPDHQNRATATTHRAPCIGLPTPAHRLSELTVHQTSLTTRGACRPPKDQGGGSRARRGGLNPKEWRRKARTAIRPSAGGERRSRGCVVCWTRMAQPKHDMAIRRSWSVLCGQGCWGRSCRARSLLRRVGRVVVVVEVNFG